MQCIHFKNFKMEQSAYEGAGYWSWLYLILLLLSKTKQKLQIIMIKLIDWLT